MPHRNNRRPPALAPATAWLRATDSRTPERTSDILRSAALSPVAPCSHASDARNTRSSQYRWRGLDRPSTCVTRLASQGADVRLNATVHSRIFRSEDVFSS